MTSRQGLQGRDWDPALGRHPREPLQGDCQGEEVEWLIFGPHHVTNCSMHWDFQTEVLSSQSSTVAVQSEQSTGVSGKDSSVRWSSDHDLQLNFQASQCKVHVHTHRFVLYFKTLILFPVLNVEDRL
jgi:hypothetical protein